MDWDIISQAIARAIRATDWTVVLTAFFGVVGAVAAAVVTHLLSDRRARLEREQRARDEAGARSRAVAGEVIEKMDEWWLPHRLARRSDDPVHLFEFDREGVLRTSRAVARILDPEVRTAVREGLSAADTMIVGFARGQYKGQPSKQQRRVMDRVGQVLQAHLRGEAPEPDIVAELHSDFEKTRDI